MGRRAPEPTSVEPPGVDPALIAEVKAHIADFTARNHAAGIRDWTAILNRLEGRDGGMSDGDIAAWLARAQQFGWEDGVVTLPKVQAALAALAAATQPADPPQPLTPPADPPPTDPPPTPAVDPAPPPGGVSAQLLADVADRAGETHLGADHIERWLRVLHTLEGVANDATIMLPAEARALVPLDPGRWSPVAEAIERLEARAFADALGN